MESLEYKSNHPVKRTEFEYASDGLFRSHTAVLHAISSLRSAPLTVASLRAIEAGLDVLDERSQEMRRVVTELRAKLENPEPEAPNLAE